MKRSVFNRTAWSTIKAMAIPILFTTAFIVMILYGLNNTEKSSRAEGLRVLEEGINQAVVTCYAIEGKYPPSLDYIIEHYGIFIDTSKYAVHYIIFSQNIMPEIRVAEITAKF